MRLGIFGGSFDPVHYGHLLLAESCREQLQLDEVWLVPAAVPPHKRGRELSSGQHRLEMLQLALGGLESLRASDIELRRGGISYTIETLRELHGEHPAWHLFLLMGGDSLADLPNWREPAEICRLAIPSAVRRRGTPPVSFDQLAPLVSPDRLQEIRGCQVSMPVVEFSSTEIRQRVAEGRSIRFRTPRPVQQYIAHHSLYGT